MERAYLILLLATGTLAAAQSSPGAFVTPGPNAPLGPTVTDQHADKLPAWNPDMGFRFRTLPAPLPSSPTLLGDAGIDSQMVVHPAQRSLGAQPPGTLVAQNLYPGLKFMPIESPQSLPAAAPMETTWPKLKIERIPTTWPKLEMTPVTGESTEPRSPKR